MRSVKLSLVPSFVKYVKQTQITTCCFQYIFKIFSVTIFSEHYLRRFITLEKNETTSGIRQPILTEHLQA